MKIHDITEGYGRYYCSTDKKWKTRKGPKQTRKVSEGYLKENASKLLSAEDRNGVITVIVQAPDGTKRSVADANPRYINKWLMKYDLTLPRNIMSKFVESVQRGVAEGVETDAKVYQNKMTGKFVAWVEINKKQFKQEGDTKEEALQNLIDQVESIKSSRKDATGKWTVVGFTAGFVSLIKMNKFFAKFSNGKLLISSQPGPGYSPVAMSGKQVSPTGKFAVIDIKNAGLDISARYDIKSTSEAGVFDLKHHSDVLGTWDTLKRSEPSLTIQMAGRNLPQESIDDQGVAEGSNDTVYPNAEVIKSKNGKPVGEIYQDGNEWGCFHYKADRGYDMIDSREDAIQALKDIHSETGRSRPDYTIKGMAEEKQRLDPKCWDGYKKQGTKMKGGVRVNNCVKEDSLEEYGDTAQGQKMLTKVQKRAVDRVVSKKADTDPKYAKKNSDTAKRAWDRMTDLEETYDGDEFFEAYGELWYNEDEQLDEAEYQGRSVPLGKPMQGDVKKFKVYVKDPSTGNVKKVNFGDPDMKIKKSNPARRRSFRARHNCDNPGPRTKARYWSCRKW